MGKASVRNDNQVCVNAALGAVSSFVRLNCYNLRQPFVRARDTWLLENKSRHDVDRCHL